MLLYLIVIEDCYGFGMFSSGAFISLLSFFLKKSYNEYTTDAFVLIFFIHVSYHLYWIQRKGSSKSEGGWCDIYHITCRVLITLYRYEWRAETGACPEPTLMKILDWMPLPPNPYTFIRLAAHLYRDPLVVRGHCPHFTFFARCWY